MRVMRASLMIVLAMVLFLKGGDCVSLLFADSEAHSCCFFTDCKPSRSDECCQMPSSVSKDYFKPEVKGLISYEVLHAMELPGDPVSSAWGILMAASVLPVGSHATTPPIFGPSVSLPLLI
jgi:hypothetical protein